MPTDNNDYTSQEQNSNPILSFNRLKHLLDEKNLELERSGRQAIFGQFVQGIVHNLRNPLYTIHLAIQHISKTLELINEKLENEEATIEELFDELVATCKHSVKALESSEQRLGYMINSILNKAKENQSSDIKCVDINSLIRSEVSFMDAIPEFKYKIGKNINLSKEPLYVNIVPIEVRQIIMNITENATEALQNVLNPTFEITSVKENDYALLIFSDNGPGIPESLREKVFQPYYSTKSLESTTDDFFTSLVKGGTGLGLWMCQEYIKHYNGSIKITDSESGGARFEIRIPLAKPKSPDLH